MLVFTYNFSCSPRQTYRHIDTLAFSCSSRPFLFLLTFFNLRPTTCFIPNKNVTFKIMVVLQHSDTTQRMEHKQQTGKNVTWTKYSECIKFWSTYVFIVVISDLIHFYNYYTYIYVCTSIYVRVSGCTRLEHKIFGILATETTWSPTLSSDQT